MTGWRRVSFTPGPARSLIARWRTARLPADDDALKMLRRISRLARAPEDPLVLSVDRHGVEAFDRFLAALHADRRETEGLEAAWLGRGGVDGGAAGRRAGAARLVGHRRAGVCRAISAASRSKPPRRLWTGYFRPHARAVFDRAAPTDFEHRVRRVARWLKEGGATVVSRADVRRRALGQTVNAERHRPCALPSSLPRLRPSRSPPRPRRAGSSRKPLAGQSGAEGARKSLAENAENAEIPGKRAAAPSVRPTSPAATGRSPSTPPPGWARPPAGRHGAAGDRDSAPCRRSP